MVPTLPPRPGSQRFGFRRCNFAGQSFAVIAQLNGSDMHCWVRLNWHRSVIQCNAPIFQRAQCGLQTNGRAVDSTEEDKSM